MKNLKQEWKTIKIDDALKKHITYNLALKIIVFSLV